MTPPGQDTNPPQVSPQQKLPVLIYMFGWVDWSKLSEVPWSRTYNTVVRPGFELATFGL